MRSSTWRPPRLITIAAALAWSTSSCSIHRVMSWKEEQRRAAIGSAEIVGLRDEPLYSASHAIIGITLKFSARGSGGEYYLTPVLVGERSAVDGALLVPLESLRSGNNWPTSLVRGEEKLLSVAMVPTFLRRGNGGSLCVDVKRPSVPPQRFAIRISDSILSGSDDRRLPMTDAKYDVVAMYDALRSDFPSCM